MRFTIMVLLNGHGEHRIFFSSFYLPESKFIIRKEGYFLGKNIKNVVTVFRENVNVVKHAMKTNLIVLKPITA